MVYKIVMQSQEKGNTVLISRYTVRQNRKPWKVGKVQTKWPCLSGQMLRVCRQISHEAITILYGKNVFQTVGFRVLRKLFLDKIGARNLAMLNSLKIDVEVDSSHRTYPYGEWTPDFLAKCERYIGLRSIQNIVMTMSYSATLQYAVRNMDVYFLIRDLGIRPYPAICACVMSSLIHTGLHMTHDFKERSYQTSDGLLLKEVTLTKLAPEVCERQAHGTAFKLMTSDFSKLCRG